MNSWINYILIFFGGCVAIYANASNNQNTLLLIIGIASLLIGLFRVSKKIPSKKNEDEV